jgi:hypothetical protein
MQAGSELQTTSMFWFSTETWNQSTKTGKIFSKKWLVYKFWNKFKNKINHGFALSYNTLKKIMQMNLKYIHFNDFKHNIVIFFTLALVERRNLSNSNNIRDVINYLKKGFRLERDISYSTGIFLGQYPGNGGKAEKTKNW